MKLCDYSLGPGGSGEGGAEGGGQGRWDGMRLPSCHAFFFFFRGVRCVAEEEKNAPSHEGPQPHPPTPL